MHRIFDSSRGVTSRCSEHFCRLQNRQLPGSASRRDTVLLELRDALRRNTVEPLRGLSQQFRNFGVCFVKQLSEQPIDLRQRDIDPFSLLLNIHFACRLHRWSSGSFKDLPLSPRPLSSSSETVLRLTARVLLLDSPMSNARMILLLVAEWTPCDLCGGSNDWIQPAHHMTSSLPVRLRRIMTCLRRREFAGTGKVGVPLSLSIPP